MTNSAQSRNLMWGCIEEILVDHVGQNYRILWPYQPECFESVYKSSVMSVIEIHHVGSQSEPTVMNLLSNTSVRHIQEAVYILLTSCCSDWMLI